MFDKFHDECGIFAVHGHPEAAIHPKCSSGPPDPDRDSNCGPEPTIIVVRNEPSDHQGNHKGRDRQLGHGAWLAMEGPIADDAADAVIEID